MVSTRMCTASTPEMHSLSGSSFFGKAVLGLIQAFCFNWMYFEIGEVSIYNAAIAGKELTSKSQMRSTFTPTQFDGPFYHVGTFRLLM